MNKPSQSSPAAAGVSITALGWKLAAWVALAVYFLLPPREVMSWGLDSSNYGSYAWMFATGRQFGADTVAMTGPFGFLAYGHTYGGYAFFEYFWGDLLFKGAFAWLAVQIFAHFPSGVWRWIWLFGLLVFLPSVDDLIYDVAILLAAIALLARNALRTSTVTTGVAATLLGFSVLMKGSHATLAGASLVFVILDGVPRGNRKRAVAIAGIALITFIAGWLGAGQHLGNLPGYFQALFALTSGYNAVMGMDPEPRVLVFGLLCASLFAAALLLNAWIPQRRLSRGLLLLLFAFFGFLQWKHGFVRADGHVYLFFGFLAVGAPLLPMILWTVDAPLADQRKIAWSAMATALAFLIAAVATSSFSVRRFGELALGVPAKFERNARFVAAPRQSKSALEKDLQQQKQLAGLSDIRRDVGSASIDFFGYEQGILLLNGLNYHPRPMGGGAFNVYHPHLQQLNAAFLRDSAQRPDFFLLKLQTIDGRLPAADDPLTLQSLLNFYQPIRARRDYVLFEKSGTPGPTAPSAPVPITQRPIALGEWVDVPDPAANQLLLFSLDLRSSLAGAARKIAYHAHALFLEVDTGGDSAPRSFLVSPLTLQVPVLISPLLSETSDVLSLYSNATPGKKVRRIRLNAPAGGFSRSGTISFSSMPRPSQADEAALEAMTYLQHPTANRPRLAISTQETGITELFGEPITVVHAPGSITFPVERNDQQIVFSFGMMPQSYDPGETDGVEFIVEYLRENEPAQLLFSRLIQPHTVAKDRGMQTARVFFPPAVVPGTVRIRTERGPSGNGAWDQSYVSHVQIKTGGFDPRQLLGFSVPPESPGFPDPQPTTVDGREARNLPPPHELKFRIPPGACFVTVGLGVLPAAYEGENHSDGIGYEIAVSTPDGREQLMKSGNLDPMHDWRARGTVTVDLPLPDLGNGSQLVLRINGGPKQDDRWDWSYVQTVRFR
ncbi:MAG: hypothetical protein ABIZ81_05560 [Opitutaceae bacterium]